MGIIIMVIIACLILYGVIVAFREDRTFLKIAGLVLFLMVITMGLIEIFRAVGIMV